MLRHEHKHLVSIGDVFELRARLSAVCKRDSHSGDDGTYYVRSLYFDSYSNKALREKLDGVSRREKFRIRYYDGDLSFIRLEKKSKLSGLCRKDSVQLLPKECERLISGDFSFLKNSENELFRELYARMRFELLRPRTVIGYRRECFIHPHGNVRVCIDTKIAASDAVRDFLNPSQALLPSSQAIILEVKWDDYLPQIIRDAVSLSGRKATAFSKYAVGRL